jgi:hypothetical protein
MLQRNIHYMKVFLLGVLQLLVISNVVPSSMILLTLMMKVICSSGTSANTRATRRHIPLDDILYSCCRQNLKFFIHILEKIRQLRGPNFRYMQALPTKCFLTTNLCSVQSLTEGILHIQYNKFI